MGFGDASADCLCLRSAREVASAAAGASQERLLILLVIGRCVVRVLGHGHGLVLVARVPGAARCMASLAVVPVRGAACAEPADSGKRLAGATGAVAPRSVAGSFFVCTITNVAWWSFLYVPRVRGFPVRLGICW